jgi:hypothetical protein
MASAQDKVKDAIGKSTSYAMTVVAKAESLVNNGFWKARSAATRTGERVKAAGQKLEDGP